MSHAADDRAFGGRILAAMSHQALHLGDVRHGLDFACAARAGTRGVVTPTTVAMLAAMEACAHAARGDASPCLRALSDAERAFARSTSAEDPAWVDFDEGGLTGHLARCFRDLNQPREAEQFAAKSIQLCRPTHLRTRVQRYAILASAHAQQGDLEGACAGVDKRLRRCRGFDQGERWTMWHISCSSSARTIVRRPVTSPSRPARYSQHGSSADGEAS
jgi:hypothetical protein